MGALGVSDNGLDSVVWKCLKKLTHLRDLDLSKCKIDDEGAAVLSGISTLENLALKETKITDIALSSFEKIPNLVSLLIPVHNVPEKGMKTLGENTNLKKGYVGGTP